MCQECGCEEPSTTIPINESITKHNDELAHRLRHEFIDKDILCVNLMGAPGSGKTTLIEGLAKELGNKAVAVIQGDLESAVDKTRLEEQGIDTFQINTHSGCHLTAQMISEAIMNMNLKDKQYVFIENVGNLVCPSGVPIGQHTTLLASAVTEGSDKPKKYPIAFIHASLVIITKEDLIPHVDFDKEMYVQDLKDIASQAKILSCSRKKPDSFKAIANVLAHKRDHVLGHSHTH